MRSVNSADEKKKKGRNSEGTEGETHRSENFGGCSETETRPPGDAPGRR